MCKSAINVSFFNRELLVPRALEQPNYNLKMHSNGLQRRFDAVSEAGRAPGELVGPIQTDEGARYEKNGWTSQSKFLLLT